MLQIKHEVRVETLHHLLYENWKTWCRFVNRLEGEEGVCSISLQMESVNIGKQK